MKKIAFIIIIIGIATALTACQNFLDENAKGALYEEEGYTTMAQLKNNAVLSIYNYIGGSEESLGLQGTGRGVYDINSLTTDEQMMPIRGGDWYDGGLWKECFEHQWGGGNDLVEDTWVYLFMVVGKINKSLEHIATYRKNCEPADTAKLSEYTAELRALRAMYYWYIFDLYGRVPILLSSDDVATDLRQSTRKEVYDFTRKELLEALPLLADETSTMPKKEYYGRMTRDVALFVLAKLTLNAEVYTGTPQWAECQDYCERIVASGDYELADTYADNFKVDNHLSPELIFTIPMDHLLYANLFVYPVRTKHYSHGAFFGEKTENGQCATLETLEAFGYGTDNVDPRFNDNFYADTVYEDGVMIMEDDGVTPLVYRPLEITDFDLTGSKYEKTAGARMKKYEHDKNANVKGKQPDNDIVLFRYADVLLMLAEAKVRQGESGLDEVNQIRRRAGAKEYTTEIGIDEIEKERRIELMWEGWRRQDAIRYGHFTTKYSFHEDDGDDHTIIFPIPDDQMNMNSGWEQNPGY